MIRPEDELFDAGESDDHLKDLSLTDDAYEFRFEEDEPEDVRARAEIPISASAVGILGANGASPVGPSEDGPVFVDLREIEAADVCWLDEPYLPVGELVTNNADGGTGKGLLAVHYGARVSRGEFGSRRMVLFAVAEDAYETVLKPRLLAAGANLAHVRGLNWQRQGFEDAVIIPDDIARLEQAVTDLKAGFLVIDPLLSHLSGRTHSHTDHEVKLALTPLGKMAQRTRCTVLGNGHFSKDKASGARNAASGSTAFTNTPRVGLAMAPDGDDADLRILEVIKSNIGPENVGRNYRVKTIDVDGLERPIPILVPEGAATKSVDELISLTKKGQRIPGELVRALILAELQTGEKSRKQLDTVALEKLGAKGDTVYKSGIEPLRTAGRIRARKDGMDGGWFYRLSLEEIPF